MPTYILHSRKKGTWRHKGVTIYLTEHNGKRMLMIWTPVFSGPRYFKTLPEARKRIDKWEHEQFKRDKPKGWD